MVKKNLENILLILGILAFVTVIFYITVPLALLPSPFPDLVITRHFVTEIDVPKNKIFDLMWDVKNYPKIFPKNYISVEIINQTDNTVFTKETVRYSNVPRTLIVKHTIQPYESHTMKILDGVLSGTVINIEFVAENSTNLKTDVLLSKVIKEKPLPNPQNSIIVDMEIHFNEIIMTPGALPKERYSENNEQIPTDGYIALGEKIIHRFAEYIKNS